MADVHGALDDQRRLSVAVIADRWRPPGHREDT
jgi:hypothetical protein